MAGKAARMIFRWIAEQPRVAGMVRRRLLAEDADEDEEPAALPAEKRPNCRKRQ